MHITIENARLTVEGPRRWWNLYLYVEPDQGDPYYWSHKLPEETFEWRVAEYGFDPADQDTLLDVVLYEPWLDESLRDPGKTHVTARTPAVARDDLLEHIRRRKGPGRLKGRRGLAPNLNDLPHPVAVDSEADDPIEVIKREMVLSEPHIEVKREIVADTRQRHRRRLRLAAAAASVAWSRPTPEQDRERLMPRRGH